MDFLEVIKPGLTWLSTNPTAATGAISSVVAWLAYRHNKKKTGDPKPTSGPTFTASKEAHLHQETFSSNIQSLLVALRNHSDDASGQEKQNEVGAQNLHNQALVVDTRHGLPPPLTDFVGREKDVEYLAQNIANGVTISGLRGMGGVGKTTLAIKVAWIAKDKYPDAQCYLDLLGVSTEPLSPVAAMEHVIRAFHPSIELPKGKQEIHSLYLSTLHGRRALLVMDNARSKQQVEPLIPPPGNALIVTSRWIFSLPGLVSHEVSCLPTDDAIKLLIMIAPHIGHIAAGELATLCGNVPLALRLAASNLAERRDLSPEEYIVRLEDSRQRLKLIDASLNLSYELLNPDLQRHWRALAVFPGTYDRAAGSAVLGIPIEQVIDVLSDLLAFSLIEFNADHNRYRLHDLARVFTASKLSTEELADFKLRHAKHYQTILTEGRNLVRRGGREHMQGLALFDRERVNIEAGISTAEEIVHRDESVDALVLGYAEAATAFYERFHPLQFVQLGRRKLSTARRLERQDLETEALCDIAFGYSLLGEAIDSAKYYELSLEAARTMKSRVLEATALDGLGRAYNHLGQHARAIQNYEQALVIFREQGNRHWQGQTSSHLGAALTASGDASRAMEPLESALVIACELGNRRGEAWAWGNLGRAHLRLGRLEQAEEHFRNQIILAQELDYNRCLGVGLVSIGRLYMEQGFSDQALSCFDRALTAARQVSEYRVEGDALWNLALVHSDNADLLRACTLAEEALAAYEKTAVPNIDDLRSQAAKWRRQLAQSSPPVDG